MKPIPKKQIEHDAYLSNGMYAVWTKWTHHSQKDKYYANADVYKNKEDEEPILTFRNVEKFPCNLDIEYTDMLEYLEGEVSAFQVKDV